MRTTAVLLLLAAATAVAADPSTDLFYKAFWLERAAGKPAEAAKLYQHILDKTPKSAEAPRALLGLIRIRADEGKDVKDLVELMKKRYPAAATEIAAAEKVAGAQKPAAWDPSKGDGTRIGDQVVSFFPRFYQQLGDDELFRVAELGTAADPMLAYALRQVNTHPVQNATRVLCMQRTEHAFEILESTLRDRNVPYRSTIATELANYMRVQKTPTFPKSLAAAMAAIYPNADPLLRVAVVNAFGAGAVLGKGREIAYGILVKALGDPDATVRANAIQTRDAATDFPKAYAEAILGCIEKKDPAVQDEDWILASFADRPDLCKRVLAIWKGRSSRALAQGSMPSTDLGWVTLAKATEGRTDADDTVQSCLAQSSAAAAELCRDALKRKDSRRAELLAKLLSSSNTPSQYLGERLREVRLEAVRGAYGPAPEAARRLLATLGVEPEDFEYLHAKPGDGLIPPLLERSFVTGIGPERAAKLASMANSQKQYDDLLKVGMPFASAGGDHGLAFFRAVVPHAGPSCVTALTYLAKKSDPLAEVVAARLLDATDWAWNRPEFGAWSSDDYPGLYILTSARSRIAAACARPPLLNRILGMTDDPRREIAKLAIDCAGRERTPATTSAAIEGLHSKWSDVRRSAMSLLPGRGSKATTALSAFATDPSTDKWDSQEAFSQLANCQPDPDLIAALRKLVEERDSERAAAVWPAYFSLAKEDAVKLARKEVFGPGPEAYRGAALQILIRSKDPNRIGVFQAILSGGMPGDVKAVLNAVASQYLVQCGEGVLNQLHNPDPEISKAAQRAIDRLKYYAEAKEALQKAGALVPKVMPTARGTAMPTEKGPAKEGSAPAK